MKKYNTQEVREMSGVSWGTVERWGDLLEEIGWRVKTGEYRNSTILHSGEGVRFLMARRGGAGPSGVPKDPKLIRQLFRLYDAGMSTEEVASALDRPPLAVEAMAEICGVFEEIEEKDNVDSN